MKSSEAVFPMLRGITTGPSLPKRQKKTKKTRRTTKPWIS